MRVGSMLPETIKTQDLLKFFKEKGYVIREKNTNRSTFTLEYILHNYDDYITQKDIKKNLHKIILEEIELYKKVTKMTESALADHIITKILSEYGLNLIKHYIESMED